MKIRALIIYALIFIGIIALDQYTKAWALTLPDSGIVVLPFLTLVPVYNSGISWGIFQQEQAMTQSWLLIVIMLVISLLLLYIVRRFAHGKWILPEVLVFAGASSNLLDRIQYGAVIDFIRFSWHGWSFPYFNVADIAIVTGVIGMLLYTLYVEHHELA